jgi:hypothetical protein
VDEASALLGHPYFIDGTVVKGDARGRTIGFPTANVCTTNELLPPNGVYATTAIIDGVVWPSVTNIGTRPTVDSSGRITIETHVFDFDRDLYGTPVRVAFVQRLRDERAFESLELLKAQIALDCGRPCCLVAFRCKSAFVPPRILFAISLSAGPDHQMLTDVMRAVLAAPASTTTPSTGCCRSCMGSTGPRLLAPAAICSFRPTAPRCWWWSPTRAESGARPVRSSTDHSNAPV